MEKRAEEESIHVGKSWEEWWLDACTNVDAHIQRWSFVTKIFKGGSTGMLSQEVGGATQLKVVLKRCGLQPMHVSAHQTYWTRVLYYTYAYKSN